MTRIATNSVVAACDGSLVPPAMLSTVAPTIAPTPTAIDAMAAALATTGRTSRKATIAGCTSHGRMEASGEQPAE